MQASGLAVGPSALRRRDAAEAPSRAAVSLARSAGPAVFPARPLAATPCFAPLRRRPVVDRPRAKSAKALSSSSSDLDPEAPSAHLADPARRALLVRCLSLGAAVLALEPVAVAAGAPVAGWRLLALLSGTLACVAAKPLPAGLAALVGLSTAVAAGLLPASAAFQGAYGAEVPWLVVLALWIARGVARTGLGERCACALAARLGGTPLGLTYALVLAEAALAPAIPSVAARSAGVVLPLAVGLGREMELEAGWEVNTPTADPNGCPVDDDPTGPTTTEGGPAGLLHYTLYQTSAVSSAMFLTGNHPASRARGEPLSVHLTPSFSLLLRPRHSSSTAIFPPTLLTPLSPSRPTPQNPLSAALAAPFLGGAGVGWGSWAWAAAGPGVASLVLTPAFLAWLYPRLGPSTVRSSSSSSSSSSLPSSAHWPGGDTREAARRRLAALGPFRGPEAAALAGIVLALGLWTTGGATGLPVVPAAAAAVLVQWAGGAVDWQRDCLGNTGAWDTFLWFGALASLAGGLRSTGLVAWGSGALEPLVAGLGLPWPAALAIIVTVYTVAHYGFASNVSHVAALYAPTLAVAVAAGSPALPAALALAFASDWMGTLSSWGMSHTGAWLALGTTDVPSWLRLGAATHLFHLVVWGIIGALWWRFIGLV